MKIGEAAAQSGVSAKMIRYYESIGLLRRAERRENSYRDFDSRDVHDLRFIRRSRSLGFSVDEIGRLLALWRDTGLPHSEVKQIVGRHIRELEERIAAMNEIVDTLKTLSARCSGHDRPDCPILAGLSGDAHPH
jgi:Cu(I)-responsive transcriptional regulator